MRPLLLFALLLALLVPPVAADHRPDHGTGGGGGATPTPTRPRDATATPGATSTPAPTATPGGGPVPACTGHDDRAWHPLVERDAAGAITCTHGHEHGDDPRALDDALGPLPAYLGGSISAPWETPHENAEKHKTYKWYVYDVPCVADYGWRRLRVQLHDNSLGWMTRFHSGWGQAQACSASDPSYSGIMEIGGWFDWGILKVDGQHVPLPGDPTLTDTGRFRSHGGPSRAPIGTTWYGYNDNIDRKAGGVEGGTFLSVAFALETGDPWGPVDPQNPSADLRYGGDSNASKRVLHRWRIQTLRWMDQRDGAEDGTVNLSGFTDRHGYFATGCTAVSLDCIPYRLMGLRVDDHEFIHNHPSLQLGMREYDVQVGGVSLIQHPN